MPSPSSVASSSAASTATSNAPVSFDEFCEELSRFRQIYGHSRVFRDEEWGRLERWLYKQKRRRQGPFRGSTQLTRAQIDRLDALGVVWLDETRMAWETGYHQLAEFRDAFGHCNVPATGEWMRLAQWTAEQRDRYHGKKGARRLSAKQTEKLRMLGFDWNFSTGRLNDVEEEGDEEGEDISTNDDDDLSVASDEDTRTRSSRTTRSDSPAVLQLRPARRKSTGGSVASSRPSKRGRPADHDWEANFAELERFQLMYGHCRVP